ncbi:MAG: acyl-CoA thioesterase [Gemmatimonadetes bacterium]|nr:acyl-CoA thioesterase [Gemmatimonadota bacterium]
MSVNTNERIKSPTSEPAIRAVMMPRDTNAANTIFGGVLLSYIDQAGFVEARRQAHHRYVTLAVREVVFRAPVFVGDTVSFHTKTVRIGRTSITVQVKVTAERFAEEGVTADVTEAELVMVAIDENCKPVPIFSDGD